MTAEKMSAGQPPSLVVTGKGTAVNKCKYIIVYKQSYHYSNMKLAIASC